jgi:hypothetical protein
MCPCPAGEYAKVASPDSQPARCFFCGKVNKHKSNGSINDCNAGSPCPFLWVDPPNPDYVKCGNLIDNGYGGTATLMGTEALESAEIRGWITHIKGANLGEDEYEMDILLDVGWRPNPGWFVRTPRHRVPVTLPAWSGPSCFLPKGT